MWLAIPTLYRVYFNCINYVNRLETLDGFKKSLYQPRYRVLKIVKKMIDTIFLIYRVSVNADQKFANLR